MKLEIHRAHDEGVPSSEPFEVLEDAREERSVERRIEKEDRAVENGLGGIGLHEFDALDGEGRTPRACATDERRLDFDAAPRGAREEMHEEQDAAEAGAEIHDEVGLANGHVADHGEDLLDAAWQVRDGSARKAGYVGWWRVDTEELVDPGVALGRGNVSKELEEPLAAQRAGFDVGPRLLRAFAERVVHRIAGYQMTMMTSEVIARYRGVAYEEDMPLRTNERGETRSTSMSTKQNVMQRYIDAWNETDAGRRRAILAEVYTEDCTYTDPIAAVSGREGIDQLIAGVQKQYPGLVFSLAGKVDAHHDQARFTWQAGAPGHEPAVIGFDVAVLQGDRIRSVYGFLDKVPG